MPVTLEQRMEKQAKMQARTEERAAKLKVYVRKARTRELVGAGEAVEEAGLLKLRPADLLRVLQACQAVLAKSGSEKLIRGLQALVAKTGREEAPEFQSAAE